MGYSLAIFPPVLIFVMLAAVIRPAIKGREPSGINYILWILSLILMAAIFQLPFGSFSTISDALKKPEVCRAILFTDWLATIISILLIVLTFRSNLTTPYVPMKKFKIDTQLIFFWLLSLLPLLLLLSSKSPFLNPDNLVHPLFAALSSSLKSGAYFAVLIGSLSLGFFGPVLEEIIFRGMLLEDSHEKKRSKGMRYFLDFCCLSLFCSSSCAREFCRPIDFGSHISIRQAAFRQSLAFNPHARFVEHLNSYRAARGKTKRMKSKTAANKMLNQTRKYRGLVFIFGLCARWLASALDAKK